MNKNDFRVQLPLWSICLWFILMIWMHGVVYMVDMYFSNFEGSFGVVDDSVIIYWNIPGLLSLIIGTVLIIVFFIAYFIRLNRHNKENPNNQLNAFSFIRLGEFLEEDEMLRHVTKNATKKVYILLSNLIPLVIFLMIFPINRYVFIVVLFLLMIAHNALYYMEIRKFLSGAYTFTDGFDGDSREKSVLQKFGTGAMVLVIVLILALGAGAFLQLKTNHESNMERMEDCLAEGGTVVVEGSTIGTKVLCEKTD